MENFSDMLEESDASVSSEGGSQELDAYLAEPLSHLEERAVTACGPETCTGFIICQKLHGNTYVSLQHQWPMNGCFQGQVMFRIK